MRKREESLMLAGMSDMFTSSGKARVTKCTIDGFCRTQIYEFCGAFVAPGDRLSAQTIYQKKSFRATIVTDPQTFLSMSTFSPHYRSSCSLRHDVGEAVSRIRTANNNKLDRLFVVMEEYKSIRPTDLHNGECLIVDQELMRGGKGGDEAFIALRTQDGAWPDEAADSVSENLVLAAIKIEQEITYGFKALVDSTYFVESGGNIVHIQEGYMDLAFGGLRVEKQLSDDALEEKASKLKQSILTLEQKMKLSCLSELVTALRLRDTRDKTYLCLWYLRLWEAACGAGSEMGQRQFGNPDGQKHNQDGRRKQLEHRNDVAHGRLEEIDYVVFDRLQRDVLKLLKDNVVN